MAAEEGTESLAAKRRTEGSALTEQLMDEVCERENCKQALRRVRANKGSPGVDGMTAHKLARGLALHCPSQAPQSDQL
jgi:RNA-directed DNA polymerase